jgi:predicted nucleic acid-binding protein
MAAEQRNFTDSLESVLYWDCSFVTAFFDPAETWHTACVDFAGEQKRQGIIPVVSDFVFDEFAFLLIRDELRKIGLPAGQFWRDVHKTQPDAVSRIMPGIQPQIDRLEALTINLTLPESVRPRAFQLMHQYSLLPTDAYHVATALDHGINAFASLDDDFLRVDGIIVYTVS